MTHWFDDTQSTSQNCSPRFWHSIKAFFTQGLCCLAEQKSDNNNKQIGRKVQKILERSSKSALFLVAVMLLWCIK